MGVTTTDRCRVPQAFWRVVESIGIPPSALLRQARLPATLHLGGPAIVTTAQYFALMRALEELSGEPALGIRLIEQADTSVHPPSSLAAFYARDFRDGLARLARFKRLCTPERLSLVEVDGTCIVTVEWLHAVEDEPAISRDVTFATLIELGRRGTGQPITPRRVEFARSAPKSERYEAYFRAPVRYGAGHNALVFDRADLDRPFPGHNPELVELLTAALGTALKELDAHASVSEQVLAVLKRSLPSGRPDIADIGRQLGMSERSLQRRITDEGNNFRDLLIEARQEMGRRLLADVDVGIDEVACLLGYQDTSSFHRAFRQWEGISPSRWRDLNATPKDKLDRPSRPDFYN